MNGANLANADLTGSTLQHTSAMNGNFQGITTNGNDLGGRLTTRGSELTGSNFTDAQIPQSSFDHTDLTATTFTSANLTQSNIRATAQGADFTNAQLAGAKFGSETLNPADITDATFAGADLERANFLKVNAERAQFQGANLTWVHMNKTDLTDANLEGATIVSDPNDMKHTVFSQAKTEGIIGLPNQEQQQAMSAPSATISTPSPT